MFNAICVQRSVRRKHQRHERCSYLRSVPPARDKSAKRFVPASLFPYGGFGDPEVEQPYFRVPRHTDPDDALLAPAQDRLARSVRRSLARLGMTDVELESRLGYRRTGLLRKLNGNEPLTMRDVVRLGTFFKGDLFEVFVARDEEMAEVVAEPAPRYRSDPSRADARDLVADAAQRLREAADLLRASGSARQISEAEVLVHMSKAVLALGANTKKPRPRS